MAGDKRILIETLLEAAAEHHDVSALSELSDRIRAATLLNSSHSPDACARVLEVRHGEKEAWQGLMVGDLAISAAFEQLAERSDVPPGLAAREPELTAEEWRAAMLVIAHLLKAFEHHDDEAGLGK